jgi:hypothetical protein
MLRKAPVRWPWASLIEIGSLHEPALEEIGVAVGFETVGAWLQAIRHKASSGANCLISLPTCARPSTLQQGQKQPLARYPGWFDTFMKAVPEYR